MRSKKSYGNPSADPMMADAEMMGDPMMDDPMMADAEMAGAPMMDDPMMDDPMMGDPMMAEDAMAAERARGEQMAAAAAAAAPIPDKPYTTKKIEKLSVELNKTVQKLAGDREEGMELPSLEWEAPENYGKRWPDPLPAPVFAPLFALDKVAKDLGFEKHDLKLDGLTNDSGITQTQVALRGMAKDKKFAEAVRGPVQQPDEMPAPPPRSAMAPMDEEEAALAEGAMA